MKWKQIHKPKKKSSTSILLNSKTANRLIPIFGISIHKLNTINFTTFQTLPIFISILPNFTLTPFTPTFPLLNCKKSKNVFPLSKTFFKFIFPPSNNYPKINKISQHNTSFYKLNHKKWLIATLWCKKYHNQRFLLHVQIRPMIWLSCKSFLPGIMK